jgi:hypothetical protein
MIQDAEYNVTKLETCVTFPALAVSVPEFAATIPNFVVTFPESDVTRFRIFSPVLLAFRRAGDNPRHEFSVTWPGKTRGESRFSPKTGFAAPPARSHPRLFFRNRILEPDGAVAPDGLDSSLESGLQKKLFARFHGPRPISSGLFQWPWRRCSASRMAPSAGNSDRPAPAPGLAFPERPPAGPGGNPASPVPGFPSLPPPTRNAKFLTCLMASIRDSDGSQIRMVL